MPRLRSTLLAALAAGIALPAFGVTPALAGAGFTQPQRLGATADAIDLAGAVVSPTGRTGVLWRSVDERPRSKGRWRMHYVVATGSDPAHLGRPSVLDADGFAADPYSATLSAFPDGTLAACFQSDPRTGDATAGCMFAPPRGDFGPLRAFARTAWRNRLLTSAIPRADGRLVVLTSVLSSDTTRTVTAQLMDQAGTLSSPQPLGTAVTELAPHAEALDDGTIAITWTDDGGLTGLARTDQLAVLRPGSDRFDAPVGIHLGDRVYSASLTGGRQLLLGVDAEDDRGDVTTRYRSVGLDGSLGQPALLLPRATKRGRVEVHGTPHTLADGSLFAVTQAFQPDESDCDSTPFSAIAAGPLVREGTSAIAPRLSARGQIAERPDLAVLADGSLIATWSDSMDYGVRGRLEAAVRPPGATQFKAPQVLPQLSRDYLLAPGGDRALLVWSVSKGSRQPAYLVTSAFARAGKLAARAPRPSPPTTRCD